MKVTVEELQRLANQDIRELRREDLDNAGEVTVDRSKPARQRMMEFLEKTRNPYAVNVGDYILKISYSNDSPDTLEDVMVRIAKSMTMIPM